MTWDLRQIDAISDISPLYESVGANLLIVGQFCDYTGSSYTSTVAATLLEQLADFWSNIYYQRHLVHLFTDKDLNDIGFALVNGALDNPKDKAYSLAEQQPGDGFPNNDSDRKILNAHEIGHLFNGAHSASGNCGFPCFPYDTLMDDNVRSNLTYEFSRGTLGPNFNNEERVTDHAIANLVDQNPIPVDQILNLVGLFYKVVP